MQPVNREQFLEWESHPVTAAVKQVVKERIEQATSLVVNGPSNSQEFDQFMKGMIRAFNEVLDVQLEEISEEPLDEVQS